MADNQGVEPHPSKFGCDRCPLRARDYFRPFSGDEIDFVRSFKTGLLEVDAGGSLLVEGDHSAYVYTVVSGWGFRFKTLEDGRRQILNYIMPGDLIGMQSALMDEMQHSAQAISPMTMCVFERRRLPDLYRTQPGLAFDITWLTARTEGVLDENLLTVGRRTALERVAFLLVFLYRRARDSGLSVNGGAGIPLTQQHIADTLGMSLVHTNKTLRKLSARRLLKWQHRGYEVLDEQGLMDLAEWQPEPQHPRPFI